MDEINNIQNLIEALESLGSEGGGALQLWFRGQGGFEWGLRPSLVRLLLNGGGDADLRKLADIERYALLRFQQLATAVMPNKNQLDEAEWLLLMQHYRLPTRLLDWTENPLVALYFAVKGSSEESDGALWVLDPLVLNKNVLQTRGLVDALTDLASIESWLPQAFTGRPSEMRPVAVIARRIDPRMIAQQGVFTLHASLNDLETDIRQISSGDDPEAILRKFRIPKEQKEKILHELKLLGLDEATLFPDLEHVAKFIHNEVVRQISKGV